MASSTSWFSHEHHGIDALHLDELAQQLQRIRRREPAERIDVLGGIEHEGEGGELAQRKPPRRPISTILTEKVSALAAT